ncbi:hypothetical protein CMI37_27700 [Candidatus Pacearchaeota archaeon]|nr:hypothetical protein [Candidatus Pacearchaeota archaeon]
MVYAFDVDGTICTNTYGEYESSRPYEDRIKYINSLYDRGETVYYLTARGMGRSNNDQMRAYALYEFTKNQLDSWGAKYHQLFMGKPNADIFVDDKGSHSEAFFSENLHK